MIRMINSKNVRFLYCAPHTFYFGDDMAAMIREAARRAGPRSRRRHLQPQGLLGPALHRQPAGSKATVHQHMDIGQGEVDWDVFFGTLAEVGFDGIMTACVFAWEERGRRLALHAPGDAEIRRQILDGVT